MTEQEIAGSFFMLYMGITLMAMSISACVLAAIDAHFSIAAVIGCSWGTGVILMLRWAMNV